MSSIKYPAISKVLIAGFFILFFTAGCEQQTTSPIALSGQTMGTTYHIKVSNESANSHSIKLKKDIDDLLLEVNQTFSTYIATSEVSQLNAYRETKPKKVSPALMEVLREAIDISKLTEGAYDVTIGPLVNIWGFGPNFNADDIPNDEELARAKKLIGYQHISLDLKESTIRKLNPAIYIDFSSIAKGYGVDRVAQLLESKGYMDYMVEIGGEMRVKGENEDGSKWRIAVEEPDASKRAVHRVINVTDIAIATSGNYRNFFEKDGVRFSHTIDPKTAKPVQHKLASVTILSKSSMTADAWATAFMVLGEKKGYDLAIEHEIAVLFLVKTGNSIVEVETPSFSRLTKESKR